MNMDPILEEVRRDVFENPKPTIDLDYLYSVKKEIEKFADDTNSQLKQNVYQNYSLFIESSREIATLKEEMRQLNTLLEDQQTSMNKLLDQLNKTPIIQPTSERAAPQNDIFGNLNNIETNDEEQKKLLPDWFVKSPEEFDVLIAQRNLKEAVELVKRIREHFVEYPKCCDNDHVYLREKIDSRIQETINVISSELQPVTDKSVQGGPRSSISSIQLLRELYLSSRAVKLYLDLRTSVLKFVLEQQKQDTTALQFIKQICKIFFHCMIETCNEFEQAFELEKYLYKALSGCEHITNLDPSRESSSYELVAPIYKSEHPRFDSRSMMPNGNDISSQILNSHSIKVTESSLFPSRPVGGCQAFYHLSTYSSLIYWITLEMENFITVFHKNAFNNASPLSLSIISESIYYLKNQCKKSNMPLDMSEMVERKLKEDIRRLIEDSGRKLLETIKRLDAEEKWLPQKFQNKAEKTRFLEEMNDVDLTTMSKYVNQNDFTLNFSASKTAFARCFLITVNDLAKLVTPLNKEHVDTVLARAFEIQMKTVIEALNKAKVASKTRFILGNSNFLLDKVILVAGDKYTKITNLKCQKLLDLRPRYKAEAESIAKL